MPFSIMRTRSVSISGGWDIVASPKLNPEAFKQLDGLFGAQGCKARRRFAAANENRPRSVRQLGKCYRHDVIKVRVCRHFLIVVENQCDRRLEAAKELAKEIASEGRQSLTVLRRQKRQGPAAFGCGKTQEIKKSRQIMIAGVDLKPKMG
jgi:hypothetical protein